MGTDMVRKLLILPPIAIGAIALVLFAKGRREPERVAASEVVRAVEFMTIRPRALVPKVFGYGTANPSRKWSAVAEIAGRVVHVSPLLNEGEVVPAGHELIRIDDTDKLLEVARLKAEAAGYDAQLARIEATRTNIEALIEVEKRSLKLAQKEQDHLETLLRRKSISEADVDSQRRAVLSQSAAVVNLENSLRLLPSEKAQLQAQVDATSARLKVAERDVGRAVIRTPFACRIESQSVELTQSVTVGQTLAETYGIQVAEIEARVAVQQARHLFEPARRPEMVAGLSKGVDWAKFGIQATVRLRMPGQVFEWKGRFARATASLDPATRAAGIVIAVDQPYAGREPGKPPLMKGLFVEVELRGPPRKDCIVVPRAALRSGRAYLVGDDNRLVIRAVTVDFSQGDETVIASGLKPGDRLVLTDVVPAIEGMLLEPKQ